MPDEVYAADTVNVEDTVAADALVDALARMVPAVGLETRLGDFGVDEQKIPDLCDGALRQARLLSYNFKAMQRSDIENVYRSAL